ncbi:MAG: RimK family alpha-L-glutamate ligase [Zetaproteobacteria bacterium CG06_land_8_20_14_3_00_59_53]|nr:MAG: carboxylate--amine ligase [Zetaproteobacteria bacterium CG2_30_59_37]PIO90631.1 MAG: RimK family alpha-L-glutamate ligase [Zetaproteobacteria bacterium CG23_combo_of_CG06-09_8_20_14_all_59_86]PIQ66105.1 MAG: RimK family alpha-L-glutamate ligase [Zetaproteobacteria bacterium CG11_big_fil_rev_8_21_14_0_20_59_439]PIU71578.1 MAG: RimK family alpha-L-glutamate ligase [Zetaproteobacteria bacterium CG06_land_8_20_14_3_00_59_53]PIU97839.1 MAG: RimK family alpha-L-glutamate ligase [Zetaproteobac
MPVRHTVIVDRLKDWKWDIEGLEVLAANDYLTRQPVPQKRPMRIINLCRHYTYLSGGYYCSLLAEARSDIPMPTIADIIDLSRQGLYAFALPDLESLLEKTVKRLAEPPVESFDLYVFFGQAGDARFKRLAAEVFDVFRYPLLKVVIERGKRWKIRAIRPMGLHQVTASLGDFFETSLRSHARVPRKKRSDSRKPALYDLAILYNPNDKMPPSDMDALDLFIKAGHRQRVDVELITRKDFSRIAEYDALFIRETTSIDNHTFRFARKAEAEGMPVIDDPKSIIRCTNKVYLWERLTAQNLPTPKTIPLNRYRFNEQTVLRLEDELGYPMVLKIPDGSFSRGMFKCGNRAEVLEAARSLFAHSRIILAQEFMYTAYDWRIGILNGKPLYACQYRQARGHWQIVNHEAAGSARYGGFETMYVEDAPPEVVRIALESAALIGNGFYGVDLKQNDKGIFVIEVNDNPSLDESVEDKVLKGALYDTIIGEFIRRIEAMRNA